MTQPAPRPATYQDILALPEHVVGEIVDGELVVSPRPAVPHTVGSTALAATLVTRMQFGDGGPGGWWILNEPELHLGEHIVVPDLAGWRRERMPTPPREAFITVEPDWICEVLSPSNARFDRTRKVPLYARLGIPHLWLLDPSIETLETYRLDNGYWILLASYAGDDVVRAEPFNGIDVDLKRVWGR